MRAVAVVVERRGVRGVLLPVVKSRVVLSRLAAPPSSSSPESITATVTPAPVAVLVDAGFKTAATTAHGVLTPRVHDIVTVLSPGSVLPAPRRHLIVVPVRPFQVENCWAPAVSDFASPLVEIASTTTSPRRS